MSTYHIVQWLRQVIVSELKRSKENAIYKGRELSSLSYFDADEAENRNFFVGYQYIFRIVFTYIYGILIVDGEGILVEKLKKE